MTTMSLTDAVAWLQAHKWDEWPIQPSQCEPGDCAECLIARNLSHMTTDAVIVRYGYRLIIEALMADESNPGTDRLLRIAGQFDAGVLELHDAF